MTATVTLALVGIGGYGNSYVNALLDTPPHERTAAAGDFRVTAAVDPAPHLCRRLDELTARGVRVFRSLDEFYATERADLAVISTPLHLHAEHTSKALSHGSHVLCEKPLCVSPDDVMTMTRARDAAGKQVAIGYQWSFAPAIQKLKADILGGAFGRPKRMRCLVLWPRDEVYYSRNRWAGAKTDAYGHLVLDSPVNNACAHYLHNLFYLLGPAADRSDDPVEVTAELYRANPIENYDTAAVRCRTAGGTEIFFVVSHATRVKRGPVFSCEFERATIGYVDETGAGGVIVACYPNGTTKSYGSPNEHRWEKLWSSIRAARDGTRTICGIEAASAHTQTSWAAQQGMPEIASFPKSMIRVVGAAGARRTWVEGLDDALGACYESFKLPSESGAAWANSGRAVQVERSPQR